MTDIFSFSPKNGRTEFTVKRDSVNDEIVFCEYRSGKTGRELMRICCTKDSPSRDDRDSQAATYSSEPRATRLISPVYRPMSRLPMMTTFPSPQETQPWAYAPRQADNNGQALNTPILLLEMITMKRILICEDEDTIREFVVINLKRAGYDVVDVNCGEAALETFESEHGNFDIVLLDIMMPGIDGFTVCKKIREKSSTIGIIMLTARTQEMDKVSGLMIGADDYITKPFSPSELTARVDAIHRRVCMSFIKNEKQSVIESGPFVLNLKSRTVTKNGAPIELTPGRVPDASNFS